MNDIWAEVMVDAFRDMMKLVALFLPKLLALVSFIVLGIVIGLAIKAVLQRLLKALRIDVLCERWGLRRPKGHVPRKPIPLISSIKIFRHYLEALPSQNATASNPATKIIVPPLNPEPFLFATNWDGATWEPRNFL